MGRMKESNYKNLKDSIESLNYEKLSNVINTSPEALILLKQKSHFKDLLKDIFFPNLTNLGRGNLIEWNDFPSIVPILFEIFEKEIIFFVNIKEEIDSLILENEIEKAILKIKELEELSGISIWSLERKIIIDLALKKIELKESEYFKLLSSNSISKLLKYCISPIIDKTQLSYSSLRTLNRFTERVPDEMIANIMSYFFCKNLMKNDDIAKITKLMTCFSLIDIYEALIFFSTSEFKNDNDDKLSFFKRIIPKTIIQNDYRLKHLKPDYIKSICTFNLDFINSVEMYTKGQYEELILRCKRKSLSKDFDYLFLLIKAKLRSLKNESELREHTPLNEIYRAALNQRSSTIDTSNEGYNKLVALMSLYNSFAVSDNILEYLSDTIKIESNVLSSITLRKKNLFIKDFDKKDYSSFELRNTIITKYGHFVTTKLFIVKWNGEVDQLESSAFELPEHRYLINRATNLLVRQEFSLVENILERLSHSSLHSIDEIKVNSLKIKHLRSTKQFDKLFSLLYKTYSKNKSFFYHLNYSEILEEIYTGKIHFEKSNSNYLKFLLSVYDFNPEYYFVLLKQSLRFFTKKHEISSISKLLECMNCQDSEYYFFEVILKGNLIVFTNITKTSEELFKSKIEGYIYLKFLTPELDAHFDNAIKSLIEQKILEIDIQNYDKEKIYIDVDSILEIIKFENLHSIIINARAHTPLIVESEDGQKTTIDLLHYTLIEIVNILLTEYTQNTKFGLSTSLSLGISHGVLENFIKSILSERKLLLNYSVTSEKDQLDDYWLTSPELYLESDELIFQIEASMQEFNNSINNNIKFLLKERLQIHIQKKPTESTHIYMGDSEQFATTLTPYLRTSNDIDTDNFVRKVIELFNEQLDLELMKIREYIETDFKNNFSHAFLALNQSLEKIPNQNKVSKIRSEILEVEELIIEKTKQISGWFCRRETSSFSNERRSIQNIVLIAKTYHEKYINMTKKIKFNISGVDKLQIQSQHVQHFIDIFYNLIQNTITYSNLPEDQIYFNLTITKSDYIYMFEYRNPIIDSSENFKSIEEKLKGILQKISNTTYLLDVPKDNGGSGIPKIEKLLTHDIKDSGISDISMENNEFVLRFNVMEEKFED